MITPQTNLSWDLNNWRYTCPNCGRINIQDSKRPKDKCHRCGFPRSYGKLDTIGEVFGAEAEWGRK